MNNAHDDYDPALENFLDHKGRQDREAITANWPERDRAEFHSLIDVADLIWEALHEAPALDADPTAAMLGLIPEHEVHEPRQTCDISGCPPAVDDVAPPTGAGHMASASRTGTGGHPVRSTSELLDDAAHRITRAATSIGSADNPLIQEFVAELRDRAASFAAFGD